MDSKTPKLENPNPNYLPDEILIEIFSRVPAKSVGRFRCLSKSWRANLCTSQFIDTHLTHTTNRKDDVVTILLLRHGSLQTIRSLFDEDDDAVIPRNLDFPRIVFEKVLGCCNGLVLMLGKEVEIFVVNPLTLQQVTIPKSPLSVDVRLAGEKYGFGYDSRSDDYKIVRIYWGFIAKARAGPFVDVFSMKNGSWKRLNSCPFSLSGSYPCGYGILVNESIHWLARSNNVGGGYVIAAFDLATESFNEIPLPNHNSWEWDSCTLQGNGYCLFLVDPNYFATAGLWIMKEYGQVNSWIKCSKTSASCILYPKCAMGNDGIVLAPNDSRRLIGWKLIGETTKAVIVNEALSYILGGCTLTDSLVSPIQYAVAG